MCEWLSADQTASIDEVLDGVIGDAAARERLVTWSKHYFGDTAQGAPTQRFHDAIEVLIAKADERLRS